MFLLLWRLQIPLLKILLAFQLGHNCTIPQCCHGCTIIITTGAHDRSVKP